MDVTMDADEAARMFRDARADAPAWPAWDPARANVVVWVDAQRHLRSMLFVDPTAHGQIHRLRAHLAEAIERAGTDVERADGPDGDETMPATLLYATVEHDGTIAGPGYGQLGQQLSRCRRLEDLVERALTDLAAALPGPGN